ncbi:MAG: recombinase family protein [Bryobacterales bacterium]|nr:recombinase family protein [Bryobacterales bacterium]
MDHPQPPELRTCAVYTRQSVKTEGDLTSCEAQRQMCVDFVRSAGCPAYRLLDERFDDNGESGASLNRPAMQRLLAALRSGRVDVVVVHRLDRLSRRVADCTALLEEFRESGVELRIAAMPELAGGAFDTLLLNLLACFAEFERELIASRISDRRAGLILRGRRIAGRTPYGYSADRMTKQLIPTPDEAAIVRELFELISSGVPPSQVERIAADRRWQTRNGRPWTARQVLDTVSNPAYTGRFRAASGTRPAVHEPIVSQDTFKRCADAVAARRTGTSGPRQHRMWSILQGKVRCARCGELMGIHTNSRGSVRYVSFRCRRAAVGRTPCAGTQVRVFDIDHQVESIFRAPAESLSPRRGRPPLWLATIHALSQVFSILNVTAQHRLVGDAVKEVIWKSDSGRIRISFNEAALVRYSEQLLGFPHEVVMSVCRPGHGYQR